MKIKKITIFGCVMTVLGLFMMVVGFNKINFSKVALAEIANVSQLTKIIKTPGKEIIVQYGSDIVNNLGNKNYSGGPLKEFLNQKYNAAAIRKIDIDVDAVELNLYNTNTSDFEVKIETNSNTIYPEVKLDGRELKIELDNENKSNKSKKILNVENETKITVKGPFNNLQKLDISASTSLLNLNDISNILKSEFDLEMSKATLNNLNLQNIELDMDMSYLIANNSSFNNFNVEADMSKMEAKNIKINNSNLDLRVSQFLINNANFMDRNFISSYMSDLSILLNPESNTEVFKNNDTKNSKNYIILKENMSRSNIDTKK